MIIIKQILYSFITVLMYLMFARAIVSWFVRDLANPVVRFLFEVTEPLVGPVRKFLQSKNIGGTTFDFSFIIVYVVLMMLRGILI